MAVSLIVLSREDSLACPYFMPVEKLENGAWQHPARLPLGCGWSGHCTAPGHDGKIPAQDVLEAFCNLGYAGSCSWAPQQRSWDAVRFCVSTPAERGTLNEAPSRLLRLLYVCERDHRPVVHGDLLIDLATATWLRRHDDGRIQKMAECFLDSYLKKKV
ncbi:MAG TPA: hypothetical protein VFA67_03265 [Candidatus Sulfotelmatobacter sp.]|nr:hypothetical protein [Candidatus Sulfotelmatobacter sp.]